MSPNEPATSPPPDEDSYNESSDDDFDPTATAPGADGDISSDDDAEDGPDATATKPAKGKRKRPAKADEEAEDVGFENSGDEAIVKRGSKRRKKQAGGEGGGGGDEDESGGEGGFVKTRRMRATAAEELARRPLATTEGSTIDVDALWVEMNDPNARKVGLRIEEPAHAEERPRDVVEKDGETAPSQERVDGMVEIEETYKFAGEVQVTKKLVPRSSSEAQKWLEEHPEGPGKDGHGDAESAATSKAKRHPETGEPLLRPLRRISLWDPNPTGVVKGLPTNVLADSDAGNRLRVVDKSKLGWHTEDAAHQKNAKATKKVNVVEKSKMDWVAHVAAMGDKEELDKAAKAKGNYLERRDFLERVEARKDEEERRVRVK